MAEAASAYGTHLSEIIPNLIRHWNQVLLSLLTGRWLTMAGAFLFLPLLNPFILISVLPFALVHTLAYTYVMKNIMLYYPAPYIPFLFFGFVLFLTKVKTKRFVNFAVIFLTLNLNLVGGSYLAVKKKDPEMENLPRVKALMDFSKPLCVQGVLIPHLGYPMEIKLLSPECAHGPFAYYLIHPRLDCFPLTPEKFDESRQILETDPNVTKTSIGGFVLYQKKLGSF
jgi:hypothetical protein